MDTPAATPDVFRFSVRVVVMPDASQLGQLWLELDRGPIQICQPCPDWPTFILDIQSLPEPPIPNGKLTIHVTDLATHLHMIELIDRNDLPKQ